MTVDLEGRVAVIVGGSKGLGKALAIELAGCGAAVAIAGRDPTALDAAAAETGNNVLCIRADVAQERDVDHLQGEVERILGAATILINAAGTYGPIATIAESDPSEWVQTLLVNAVGPYLTCRAFVDGMVSQRWGRIVNVSTAGSLLPPGPLNSAYTTSKAALNRFTRHLAVELEGTGVTANVIHPGFLKTDMWADIRAKVARVERPEAQRLREWVQMVEETGGDPTDHAVALVLQLIADGSINGSFCWPREGMATPVDSW